MLLLVLTQIAGSDQTNTARKEHADEQSSGSIAQEPLITKAIDGFSTLKDVFSTRTATSAPLEESRNGAPATLVWMRASRGFLANHMERDVDRKKPVKDYILGTAISGESRTTGKTRFVLHPNEQEAQGEIQFVGEVHARTVGHNGPAILDYNSDSTFRARKRITIDESGLTTTATVAEAPTHLKATNIRTSLPGLRNRIAQRIAWRRVGESQSQADAIVSDHTARDIRHDLDRKINESVASIQSKVKLQLAKLQGKDNDQPLVMRSRSTPDYVEVALCRRSPSGDEVELPSFTVEGNPEIAVRVHRTILLQAMTDPEFREMLAPFLGNASGPQLAATGPKAASEKASLHVVSLATIGEWTAVDLTTSKGPQPVSRVARDVSSEPTQVK